ncbi:MAG: peptidylprolyl isomerase [Deltaproteobacteria bacterium]|nr:peptidylprolyl isomerase [Deltaproteobacteria bacterium]
MLEYIRNHVGGLVGLLIIGALSFVFAVSFGQQSQGWGKSSGDDTAIVVDGVEISQATLNYALNMNVDREISQESPEYAALRQQVAKGLVERQLLLNMAQKAGVSASTEEAQENIINGEFFITRPISAIVTQLGFQLQFSSISPDRIVSIMVKDGHRASLGRFVDAEGKFDTKTFDNVIKYRLNFKEPAFVEEQRLEIIAQRMRTLLIGGIAVSENELKDTYNRENDTAKLSYIKLAPALIAGNLDDNSEELSSWIQENQDAIKQYYETNKFKYSNVEKSARARHILIKAGEDADEEAKAAAKAKAESLLARAEAGEDFAALARENSEDPGSATKGGDLGFNPRGVMVPAFDDAMFSLEPGQLSSVVETEFGYHVIKLETFREGTISLEDATEEIARKLYQENRGKEVAKKTADKLLAKLKAGTDINSLLKEENTAETDSADTATTDAPVVDASPMGEENEALDLPEGMNLFVQTTPAFSKAQSMIPGIGESEELVNTAFSLTMDAPKADKIFVVNNNYFVVQLAERKTPSSEDFDAQKEEIRSKLLSTKVVTWMNDRTTSLLDKAIRDGKIDSIIPIQSTAASKEKVTAKEPSQAPAPASAPAPSSNDNDEEDEEENMN